MLWGGVWLAAAALVPFPGGSLTGRVFAAEGDGQNAVTYTALEGTEGWGSESYDKLVDSDKDTKWCMRFDGSAYIIFQTSYMVQVTGYKITTGNDNETNPGRNPKSWTLSGSSDMTNWEVIHSVEDDRILPDENKTDCIYICDESAPYQYFKFEVTANGGDTSMQLAELELLSCAHEWAWRKYVNAENCVITGYTSYICQNCGGEKREYDESSGHTDQDEDGICETCREIIINGNNFPDEVFRNYLLKTYDKDKSESFSKKEIENVTDIWLNSAGITSLEGIAYFTGLEGLQCMENQLTELNVSGNSVLKTLDCSGNNLTQLDVSGSSDLIELSCSGNELTQLDVSGSSALRVLYCSRNNLTQLDVSGSSALRVLYCSGNELTQLDVSGNSVLETLNCSGNNLTQLDVSENSALIALNCDDNELTRLDVIGNTDLAYLDCSGNNLTQLDVSGSSALIRLYCSDNELTQLDVSRNTALAFLNCSGNNLTQLDVSGNHALRNLDCSSNQLTRLDVSGNSDLKLLHCKGNRLAGITIEKEDTDLQVEHDDPQDGSCFHLYSAGICKECRITEGTLENKDYGTEYTYSGSPVPAPAAGNFKSNIPGETAMAFEWYADAALETRLDAEPTDAGTYWLAVSIPEKTAQTGTETQQFSAACCIIKVTVKKADQNAPDLTAVGESIRGSADGRINGLTGAMEYRSGDGSGYTSVTDPEMTFAAGTYYVRFAADKNHNASPDAEVAVSEGKEPVPDTPSTPGASGTPSTPSTPSAPGTSGTPSTPSTPTAPGTSGTPTAPGTSGTPTAPSASGTPTAPGTSGTPSTPDTPSEPSASGTPTAPDASGTPSEPGAEPKPETPPAAVTKAAKEKNALTLNAGLKVSQTGNSITASWGRVSGADGYNVYVQYCGKKFTSESVNNVKGSKTASLTVKKVNGRKLDLKKNYKIYIAAYRLENGKKVSLGKSITAHVVGRNNKTYTNAKSIQLEKSAYSLKAGGTAVIKAGTVLAEKGKKLLSDAHGKEFRYASSNKKTASVTAGGKIKAVGKGSCTVYVYARNGYAKKIKVTVK